MKKNTDSGAVIVDYALMFPLAVFIIYGLLYFSLSLIVESVAESSVHTALDDAITRAELEEIPDPLPDCTVTQTEDSVEEKFCEGIKSLEETVKRIPQQAFFAEDGSGYSFAYFKPSTETGKIVDIKIPVRSGTSTVLTSEQAYDDKPIIVELNYAIQPIFPGLPQRVMTARAVGFREVQSSLSYPIPVDCQGNPFGSDNYDAAKCECEPENGQGYNESTGGCRTCTNGQIPYIPGDPVYGVKPEGYFNDSPFEGCWCPTSKQCQEHYNNKNLVVANNGRGRCQCFCRGASGLVGSVDDCRCGNQSAKTITGPYDTIVIKAGEKVTYTGAFPAKRCGCEVEGGGLLSTADCERAFVGDGSLLADGVGSAPGTVQADPANCRCTCKWGGCDSAKYGTGWHQGSPATGCSCQCSNWPGSGASAKGYECHRGGGSGINHCKSLIDGACQCDPDKVLAEKGTLCPPEENCGDPATCAKKKFSGRDCNCVCDVEALNCGAHAVVDEATCTCKCSTDSTFSGAGSCDPANIGSGGEGVAG